MNPGITHRPRASTTVASGGRGRGALAHRHHLAARELHVLAQRRAAEAVEHPASLEDRVHAEVLPREGPPPQERAGYSSMRSWRMSAVSASSITARAAPV